MHEEYIEDFSGASNSGGSSSSGSSSGDSSSGGAGSSTGSSGGSAGARGVDSSRVSPGEQNGARNVFNPYGRNEGYRSFEPYDGARMPKNFSRMNSRNQQPYYFNQSGGGMGEQGGNNPVSVFIVPQSEQEESMNTPTILPIPVSGYGAFGGYPAPVAPAVAPAYGGLGTDFYSYNAALMASENACRGIEATKESEADVKDAIMLANTQRQVAEFNNLNRVCEVEKEAIKAGFEARLESKETKAGLLAAIKDSTTDLSRQLEMCCCDIKLQNVENRAHLNEKFCETNSNIDNKFFGLERRMDKEFDAIRERECQSREAALRDQVVALQTTQNNGSIVSSLVAALEQVLGKK